MLRKLMFAMFFTLMCVCYIKAQDEPQSSSYLGPQLGWQKASDADNANLMIGSAFRAKLSPVLGLEASVNYRKEEFDNGAVNVTNWPVMVTGLIYVLPIVYGAIGAGWYNTSITYSSDLHLFGVEDQTEQKFGWHFGGGLEIPLGMSRNPGAILAADIRYVFLNYDFQKLPGSPGVNSNFVYMTVGLLFNL